MPARISIPPITRILLLVLAIQFGLAAAIRSTSYSTANDLVIPYLTLVPQLSLIYPWTFVTTTLVEQNLVALAVAGASVFYGGRYLERAWSGKEFVKFLGVVILIPNGVVFALLVLMFAVTGHVRWSLTPISGTTSLQISFLVAFAHLLPTHTVTLFKGLFSLRVPRFPLLYTLLIFLLSLSPFATSATLLLAITGFLTSYTYIRFYKPLLADLDTSQPSTLRGDRSDAFAFPEFFPDAAKPGVASVADSVFGLLVSMGACSAERAHGAPAVAGMTGGQSGGGGGSSGGSRAEAERRRALALKALDQRLHAAAGQGSKGPMMSAPSHEERAPTPTPTPTQTRPRQAEVGSHADGEGGMLGETSFDPDEDRQAET